MDEKGAVCILDQEAIDALFTESSHQADILIGLYKLVYNGSAENRPHWDIIEIVDGHPQVGEGTWLYIAEKFTRFDKVHHPEVLAGGHWMNRGFSCDKALNDWEYRPAPVTLKDIGDKEARKVEEDLGPVCENCGEPCEYDSELCLCPECEEEAARCTP